MEALPGWLGGILVVLLFTSFVKIATALSILRYGLGLEGAGFGVVILAAALALSLLVMTPQIEQAGGVENIMRTGGKGELAHLEAGFRPFMEKHTPAETLERFRGAAAKLAPNSAPETQPKVPFPVLIAAFLMAQLKDAFLLGLIIIIPFVVLDLIVANVMMSLGITQLAYQVVSLPLKVALFFAIDGWTLISDKLVASFL